MVSYRQGITALAVGLLTLAAASAAAQQPATPKTDPLIFWGEKAGAKANPADPQLPAYATPRMAPMRTQGSYVVVLPPDYETSNRRYPLVMLLHGSGDSEQLFARVSVAFGREGVIYAAPRAPFPAMNVIVQYKQPGFTAWPWDRPNPSPEAEQARRDYADWIFDVAADVARNYRVQDGKLSMYGFSQGGGMAVTCALLHPERVGQVFSEAGSAPPDSWFTPAALTALKNQRVQFTVVHGRDDRTHLPAVSTALDAKLRAGGVASDLRIVAGTHEITDEMVGFARAWVDKVRLR